MEWYTAILDTGVLSPLNLVMFVICSYLFYLVLTQQKNMREYVSEAKSTLQFALEDERAHTQALSKVVFEIRTTVEMEREKNYALREQIITLKNENLRLTNLVTEMERLVKQYKEELEHYKKQQ